MFSKINFTYKKPSQNSKSYLILKKELVKQKIQENEQKSLVDCISLKNKVDSNKIQNTNSIMEQSSENNINHIEEIEKDQSNTDKYINNFNINIDRVSSDIFSKFALIEQRSNIYESETNIHNEHVVSSNIDRIHKRGIQFINNVYQSKYENGKANSTGLGDFLRGCYFILEFCEKYNFQPKIVFNNCISKFLLIKTHNLERIDNILQGISGYRNNNFSKFVIENGIIKEPLKDSKNVMADFVDYVVKSPQYSGNVFMYCNAFPINEISEKNKEYMRKFLEPTNEMKLIINQTLHELSISFKQYIVIHIRSGDSYLKEEKNAFTNRYIRDLIINIKNDVNGNNNYLLMADSNDVKKIIKKYFPTLKVLIKPITHFGEGIVLEEEKVINTLVDFYLLSHSKSIFSYSAYEHGSGFSYWCAKTFNIPYVCKYVK
jgi:hypothetical protein